MGKISDAIRKLVDRLRGAANAAPVDATQEKQPSPIIKMPKPAQPALDEKVSMAFGRRPAQKIQQGKHRKMIKH